MPNFIEIIETFYGWTDIHMYGQTFETHFIRSTQRSRPKKAMWPCDWPRTILRDGLSSICYDFPWSTYVPNLKSPSSIFTHSCDRMKAIPVECTKIFGVRKRESPNHLNYLMINSVDLTWLIDWWWWWWNMIPEHDKQRDEWIERWNCHISITLYVHALCRQA